MHCYCIMPKIGLNTKLTNSYLCSKLLCSQFIFMLTSKLSHFLVYNLHSCLSSAFQREKEIFYLEKLVILSPTQMPLGSSSILGQLDDPDSKSWVEAEQYGLPSLHLSDFATWCSCL